MADRDRPQPYSQTYQQTYPHLQITPHNRGYDYEVGFSQKGPSTGQVLALITLVPIGAILLGLAGITLVGTLIGLAVATPLFVIFSPVLVPAAILLAGAVAGILTSGAFGITGLSSLSWVLNSFRRETGEDAFDYAKRRVQEATEQVGEKARQAGELVGEKTKQTGEAIKTKSQEGGGGRTTTTRRDD